MADVKVRLWHFQHLEQLRREMTALCFETPLVWMTEEVCKSISPERLGDMLHFAPSLWDSLVGDLVCISRGVLLGVATPTYTLNAIRQCITSLTASSAEQGRCPQSQNHLGAMLHVLHATAVMVYCLANAVHVSECPLNVPIHPLNAMTRDCQSAGAAIKSLCLQICHYASWPSLMDEEKPVFKSALQAAWTAVSMNPSEACWTTLFARCLPRDYPNKGVMLQAGCTNHPTPFTVIEFSTYLASTGTTDGVRNASELCKFAALQWPDNIAVNLNYLTMYFSTPCRSRLDPAEARACLRRAHMKAPDSALLASFTSMLLRDVSESIIKNEVVVEGDLRTPALPVSASTASTSISGSRRSGYFDAGIFVPAPQRSSKPLWMQEGPLWRTRTRSPAATTPTTSSPSSPERHARLGTLAPVLRDAEDTSSSSESVYFSQESDNEIAHVALVGPPRAASETLS